MNTGDSAEEIVKISLDGVETAFKIAGAGAKNIGAIILAKLNEEKQSKGKLRLTNMMKSGKALDIFTVEAENLKTFCEQAKKYGVRYCSLAKKKDNKIDGIVDLMVYEEDAPKIARIVERFKLKSDLNATIKQQLDNEQMKAQEKNEHDKFLDDIMPIEEIEVQEQIPSNSENTEEKNQSRTSLDGNQENKEYFKENEEKPSVIQELKEIEKEKQQEESKQKEIADVDVSKEQSPKKQRNNRGKRYKQNYNKSKKHEKGKRFREPKHFNQRGNVR